ncbi:MAG: RIP metalloprotease RseP, partial [Candidatus Rokuibacteriota bacterium]
MLMILGRPVLPAVVGRVTPESPAAEAGLQTGDHVSAIGGHGVANWEDLARAVASTEGRPTEVTIERGGGVLTVSLTP